MTDETAPQKIEGSAYSTKPGGSNHQNGKNGHDKNGNASTEHIDHLADFGVPEAEAPFSSSKQARSWLRSLDLTQPENRSQARKAFLAEYNTLARIQDQILNEHSGKYVLIHEEQWGIFPSLREASKQGYEVYQDEMFLIVEVNQSIIASHFIR